MKTNFFLVLVFTSMVMVAQSSDEKFKIPKGTYVLGGSVNFNFNDYNDKNSDHQSKTNYWGITPNVGYSFSENLILGLKTGFNSHNRDESYDSGALYERDYWNLSVSPYVRRYFPLSNKLALNLEGGVGFGIGKENYLNESGSTTNSYETDTSSFYVNITPGITYNLSNRIYLYSNLGALNYTMKQTKSDNGDDSRNNLFSFSLITTQFNFGLLVVL